jgi:hypothetical protein
LIGRVKLSHPLQFRAAASNKMMEKRRMAATGIDRKRREAEGIRPEFSIFVGSDALYGQALTLAKCHIAC